MLKPLPMKKSLIRIFSLCVFLLGITLPLHAKETKFPPSEFAKVRAFLCDADRIEEMKAIGKTCEQGSFQIMAEDLNGDGKPEWFFYGPSGECGVHGNCPLLILKKDGGNWSPLFSQKCPDNECLQWANALYSETLKTSHNGFRDLLVASDNGSFYWVKEVYEWDGKKYKKSPEAISYYFYDDEKDKLVKVSKERWDKCMKTGEGC
jgi:hypothetical protein